MFRRGTGQRLAAAHEETNEEEPMSTRDEQEPMDAPTLAEMAMAELAKRCTTLADQLTHGVRCPEDGMLAALPGGDHFLDLGEAIRSPLVRHVHVDASNSVNAGSRLVDEAALRSCRAREAAARLLPGAVRRIGDSAAMVEAPAREAGALLREAAEQFEHAREALAAHRAPPPKRCPTCRQVVPT